jgi:hypothetical protein
MLPLSPPNLHGHLPSFSHHHPKIFLYWQQFFFWEHRQQKLVLSPNVFIGNGKIRLQIDPPNFVFKKFPFAPLFLFYFWTFRVFAMD